MAEIMVPAQIVSLTTLDPGEVRIIELALPKQWEIEGIRYPVHDTMRPGTAFLTKAWGTRTQKLRRRMYTRSNTNVDSEHCLETIINFTHTERSDTSAWWQTDECVKWQQSAKPLDVKVVWNQERTALQVYENSQQCQATNLRLEPDGEWESMKFLALALSTGITPFLSYLRYMKHRNFGRSDTHSGTFLRLIVSVRSYQQLMAHDELFSLQRQFPDNFQYHPVLTRNWPQDWPYTQERIIQEKSKGLEGRVIDLTPLLAIAPDIQQYHVRFCGNKAARDQLQEGFQQYSLEPRSIRAEVW